MGIHWHPSAHGARRSGSPFLYKGAELQNLPRGCCDELSRLRREAAALYINRVFRLLANTVEGGCQ